jgi:hypothetical protein
MDFFGLFAGHMMELNLAVSLSATVAGFILYYKYRPSLFDAHPFMRWAFWYLIARWICLILIYVLALSLPGEEKLFLATLDLQSVCEMGFAWLFVQGDEASPRRTFIGVISMAAFLWIWNFSSFAPPATTLIDIGPRARWMTFSDAMSAFAVPALGFAFLIRYRAFVSFLLFLTSLGYSACQRLINAEVFLKSPSLAVGVKTVSLLLFMLLVGKLLLAGMTFGLFFAPVTSYSATMQLSPAVKVALWVGFKRGAKWLLISLPAHVVLAIIVHYIFK